MTDSEARQRATDIAADENVTEVLNGRPALTRLERTNRVESYTRHLLRVHHGDVRYYPGDIES